MLNGGEEDDRLNGGAGADVLNGGSGDDILRGGADRDWPDGGAGVDTVDYSYWREPVTANLSTSQASFPGLYVEILRNVENITTGAGNDTLTGSAAANVIQSGAGDDTLFGGDGNDTLNGGADKDVLSGGAGDDVFVCEALPENSASGSGAPIDRITDFEDGVDHLDLTAFAFQSLDDLAALIEPKRPDTLIHLSTVGDDDVLIAGINVLELSPDDILI